MAFNGSGTFNRLYNWVTDAAANIKILASRMDAEMDGFATGLTTAVTKDGQTTPTANLPMGTFKHTAVGVSTARDQYAASSQVQDGTMQYAADTGAANAYAISLVPSPTAYLTGQTFRFKATNTNTTTSTLNVNGIGVKTIKKNINVDLAAGDIKATEICEVVYDGTNFQLIATSSSLVSDQWVSGPVPTYVSATSFTLVGDQTSTFHAERRLKTTNTGGTIYSKIASSAYTSLTTVTVVNDSGTLDSGLSAVSYGIISNSNTSAPKYDTFLSGLIGARYGNIWSHNATDVTNDWDITAGGCMDSTQAYWIKTAALIKQADVAWAVGTNAGMLDTGAVANSDYYIWAIARSDTGVTDYLSSLSSTAPTMPANYGYKRLIGWFKRLAGVNTLMDVYETEGGGVEVAWRAPTLSVNLNNTLTTSRRTDAVKVPLNFSVIAHLSVIVNHASSFSVKIMCPDETDSAVTTANCNIALAATGTQSQSMHIRTSTAGLIAARAESASISLYNVLTQGFRWGRRN